MVTTESSRAHDDGAKAALRTQEGAAGACSAARSGVEARSRRRDAEPPGWFGSKRCFTSDAEVATLAFIEKPSPELELGAPTMPTQAAAAAACLARGPP